MRYNGGKGKCYQHVINLLPPHEVYIETHLGGGAVLRHKAPSRVTIGIDRDPGVVEIWRSRYGHLAQVVHDDAIGFLRGYAFSGTEVVYCDPPYLPSTRSRKRVYRFDYTEQDHRHLLETVRHLRCKFIISGYPSDLYDRELANWNTHEFRAKTHSGVRVEKLWFNFPRPKLLHDSRYVGNSFRERETVKRRLTRVKKRILTLSVQEQHHISDWLRSRMVNA